MNIAAWRVRHARPVVTFMVINAETGPVPRNDVNVKLRINILH